MPVHNKTKTILINNYTVKIFSKLVQIQKTNHHNNTKPVILRAQRAIKLRIYHNKQIKMKRESNLVLDNK